MFSPSSPLGLSQSLPLINNTNQIQQIKASGNQPRPASTSPNVLAQASALTLPLQVTGVQVSQLRTSDTTTKVTVSFSRNPADYFFINALVFVSGYKGNPSPTQVASGQSPVSFALENTGEAVTITVQASGNLGQAPLAAAPTATLQLAKTPLATTATTAGNGTATAGSGTAGHLAKWATSSTLTNADLSQDVVTSGSTVTTVQGIQTIPVESTTPVTGDIFQYNKYGDSKWDVIAPFLRWWGMIGDYNNGWCSAPLNQGASPQTVGTQSSFNAGQNSHTDPVGVQFTSAASASTNVVINARSGFSGASSGPLYLENMLKCSARFKMITTSNARWWIALVGANSGVPNVTASDTPNGPYCGFRFSSTTDSTWKAVCGTSNVAQTVVDTTVAVDTTNSQLFEMWYDGTNMNFKINNSSPVQISTNIPTFAANANGLVLSFTGDNKNTATALTMYAYHFVVCQK